MSRLIDADALIEQMDAETEGGYYSPHDVISLLMAQPVAEERKKGKWIDMDDHVMCSCCGATHYGADKNYCPNCGADMRGDE